MEPGKLLAIMEFAENLKNATRHSWTSEGRHESVAEHCWRLCLFSYFIRDEFPEADMEKVMRMCLIHDMGEAFTGDIPAFEKTSAHEAAESTAVKAWVDSLPEPYNGELAQLYDEIKQQNTQEARIFKALDNMGAVMQHNQADISTWLPLEYELQLTYGVDKADFSDYLKCLREFVVQETKAKIKEHNEQNTSETNS